MVATVSVDLGGGPPPQLRNLTWREGEALDLAVQRFAEQHGVAAEGARVLLQEARKKVGGPGRQRGREHGTTERAQTRGVVCVLPRLHRSFFHNGQLDFTLVAGHVVL